jgi:hypothetical protein
MKPSLKNSLDINLNSTTNIQGEYVTQIIHFVGGVKRTYHNIQSSSIKQGQFTKMKCKNGDMIMINDANVLCIEVIRQDG